MCMQAIIVPTANPDHIIISANTMFLFGITFYITQRHGAQLKRGKKILHLLRIQFP